MRAIARMLFTLLLIHTYCANLSMAAYILNASYTPSEFFNNFNFFTVRISLKDFFVVRFTKQSAGPRPKPWICHLR